MYITFHFFYEVTIKCKGIIKFQIPGPLGNSVLFNNEQKTGKWSVETAIKMSTFLFFPEDFPKLKYNPIFAG